MAELTVSVAKAIASAPAAPAEGIDRDAAQRFMGRVSRLCAELARKDDKVSLAMAEAIERDAGIILRTVLDPRPRAPRVTGGRAEEWRAVETMLRNLGQPGMADSAAGFRIIEAEAVKQRLQAATGGEVGNE